MPLQVAGVELLDLLICPGRPPHLLLSDSLAMGPWHWLLLPPPGQVKPVDGVGAVECGLHAGVAINLNPQQVASVFPQPDRPVGGQALSLPDPFTSLVSRCHNFRMSL